MKRREIWWIKFDPSIGTEIKKTRPAVIVSNDLSNKVQSRVQVVPITSNVSKKYPFEAILVLKNKEHKAMADQITTVSKKRCKKFLGKISPDEMGDLERAIKLQLDLLA